MALIIGIILMLSLIAVWYVTPVPKVSSLILSDLENLDFISTMEGTFGEIGYLAGGDYFGEFKVPILIEAHVYTTNVTGDNIIMRIDMDMIRAGTIRLQNATAIDLTNPICTQWSLKSKIGTPQKYHLQSWKDNNKDGKLSSSDRINMNVTKGGEVLGPRPCDVQEVEYGAICNMSVTNETIPDLSGNSTYVFNKLTRENVPDALEEYPDKNRTGYDPFYPSHLKPGEDILNVWLDNLNDTGTLEFVRTVEIEDVELYEYSLNKEITIETDLGVGPGNYTLTNTKTVLIEPLSGLPVYTKNETLIIVKMPPSGTGKPLKVVYLTYKDKEMDLVTPRLAHGAMQVLEFDKEVKGWILGAIVVILTVAFIFNTRSLSRARKIPPKAKT